MSKKSLKSLYGDVIENLEKAAKAAEKLPKGRAESLVSDYVARTLSRTKMIGEREVEDEKAANEVRKASKANG